MSERDFFSQLLNEKVIVNEWGQIRGHLRENYIWKQDTEELRILDQNTTIFDIL